MRSSFPARSSKARATAVIASTPPRRSYREPSTVPTSCALVTNGSAMFPPSRILKPCNPGQVNLYLLLTRRTGGPGPAMTTNPCPVTGMSCSHCAQAVIPELNKPGGEVTTDLVPAAPPRHRHQPQTAARRCNLPRPQPSRRLPAHPPDRQCQRWVG